MVEDVTMRPSKYTILVVDDEERLRNLIVTFLSKLGHSCVTAIDGVDALDKMNGSKINAVVTDMKMPNMDGITLAAKVSIQYPELPVMIMTAFEERHAAEVAATVGARDFIKKPFSFNEFSTRLHKMINDSEAQGRAKGEKDVDKDIQGSTNELEPLKQTTREEDIDKFIQEFVDELRPPQRMKREKGVDDGMREVLEELEAGLKKIWNGTP